MIYFELIYSLKFKVRAPQPAKSYAIMVFRPGMEEVPKLILQVCVQRGSETNSAYVDAEP